MKSILLRSFCIGKDDYISRNKLKTAKRRGLSGSGIFEKGYPSPSLEKECEGEIELCERKCRTVEPHYIKFVWLEEDGTCI